MDYDPFFDATKRVIIVKFWILEKGQIRKNAVGVGTMW
jgi:hypothetical protein